MLRPLYFSKSNAYRSGVNHGQATGNRLQKTKAAQAPVLPCRLCPVVCSQKSQAGALRLKRAGLSRRIKGVPSETAVPADGANSADAAYFRRFGERLALLPAFFNDRLAGFRLAAFFVERLAFFLVFLVIAISLAPP